MRCGEGILARSDVPRGGTYYLDLTARQSAPPCASDARKSSPDRCYSCRRIAARASRPSRLQAAVYAAVRYCLDKSTRVNVSALAARQMTEGYRLRAPARRNVGSFRRSASNGAHRLAAMNPYVIPWMDDDLEVFRDTVVRFIETEMVPHDARWREQHHVDRETWRKAGDTGLLLLDVPAEYGGGGGDFRHEAVMYTELARRGIGAFGQGVHSMCAHYVLNHGTEEQKQRLLPRMAAGELIGAICMTEPGTGSDLKGIRTRAVKQGDHYVVDGGKTFITNGLLAGLLMLVVRTDPPIAARACPSSWSRRRICRVIASAACSTRWACTARTPRSCSSKA